MKKYILYALLVIMPPAGMAQDTSEGSFPDALPPPDLPAPIQSGEPIEPDVTIIRREEKTIEEYRVNGNLYMIKVTPAIGPAYYLIDQDGDGKLESRSSKLGSDTAVPQWVLFRW